MGRGKCFSIGIFSGRALFPFQFSLISAPPLPLLPCLAVRKVLICVTCRSLSLQRKGGTAAALPLMRRAEGKVAEIKPKIYLISSDFPEKFPQHSLKNNKYGTKL